MTITEIKKMSIIERLQAMEELWDSLCHEENEIESPGWHKDILESRRKKIKEGEAEFVSLEDLKSGNYK
ncbi:MAG: addiction module protein [Candidatus Scalindua sp.]|jgi:putative addiction module component (TIGR02574 family)|nr:addiction module protein [Candidatus Scalindua sp.]MBT6046374.1 addiction module protein [Candidatus Scalindua sp.]MBT6231294.1 addiction module protein [Candidatus Scalindua sp.]MBT7211048.1 addiction module protein [Candidatus Scalindua sp.]MBT7590019.1 addiction module protein [Candidatus Scalindua sp.]